MDWLYYELAALISALLYAFYIWGTWHYDTFRKAGLPYEKPFPFLGTTASFWFGRVSLGELSMNVYNRFKGKSLVGIFDFRSPSIMILDPQLIKLITTKDFDHFVDHRQFSNEQDDPLFGKSLFSLRGSRWKSIRNILTPAFTSSKMKSMFTLVAESGKQLGDHLEEKCKDEHSGTVVVDMNDLFTRYANDVIATAAFGLHCDSLKEPNNEFYLIGKEAMNFDGSRMFVLLFNLLIPRVMKFLDIPLTQHRVNKFFQTLVKDTMRTREREGIVRPDMIHLLMQARKGTLKDDGATQEKQDGGSKGITLSDEDITAQAFLFFLAGFDTSSTLHCFLSHLLAVHPDIQRRVQEEVDAILKEDGGKLTYEGVVQRTKYLDSVIAETLRLWPPVIEIDRVCVKDYMIPATSTMPAVKIKKGQEISIPIYAIQRDAEYFPDPERFDPDRFSEENKNNFNQLAYLPFGAGPRACIGLRFAQMVTKIMAVSVLSRFDLEVTVKTPSPLRHKKKTFNTTVEGGFWLAVKPRVKHTEK